MYVPFIYERYKKSLQGGSNCIVFPNVLAVTDFYEAELCFIENYRSLVNPVLVFPRVKSTG